MRSDGLQDGRRNGQAQADHRRSRVSDTVRCPHVKHDGSQDKEGKPDGGGDTDRRPDQAHQHTGDARQLELASESADAVLLLGPLYHLDRRRDRVQALAETKRIVRPGGPVFAAALERASETGSAQILALVPGIAEAALGVAVTHGMRIAFPMMLMSSRAFGDWSCYLPRNPGFM